MQQAAIKIKKPCEVDLNHMTVNTEGRFCTVCQINVIDFTKKTPEEISAYFSNYQHQSICGTYNRADVKTDDTFYNFISWLHARKMRFLALLIVGILVLTGCKSKKQISYSISGARMLDEHKQSIENLK